MNRKRISIDIEKTIGRLATSLETYEFLRFLKDEAISAAKETLLDAGMVFEALTLVDNIDKLSEIYLGRIDPLLDIIRAIDCYAKRNIENLTILVPAKRVSKAIAEKKSHYVIR